MKNPIILQQQDPPILVYKVGVNRTLPALFTKHIYTFMVVKITKPAANTTLLRVLNIEQYKHLEWVDGQAVLTDQHILFRVIQERFGQIIKEDVTKECFGYWMWCVRWGIVQDLLRHLAEIHRREVMTELQSLQNGICQLRSVIFPDVPVPEFTFKTREYGEVAIDEV